MNHQPFTRVVPGAEAALLCIHGIIGSPDHFDMLLPLIPDGWSVYNILLDGHGKTVDDFAASSMAKWEAQVREVFAGLCTQYDDIVIAAHSMGTLFAIELALERPDKVPFLFLMAPPMRVHLTALGLYHGVKTALGRIDPDDPLETAMRDAYSLRPDPRLLRYIRWLPRYAELLRLIRKVRGELPQLTVPCYAFQSCRDELVAPGAAKVLKGSGRVELTYLPNSWHFYYPQDDKKQLLDAFAGLCARYEAERKTLARHGSCHAAY